MENNNYYYLEQLENGGSDVGVGDGAMIEHMVGENDDQEKESFLVGYEANGGLIEGMEGGDDGDEEEMEGFEGNNLIEGLTNKQKVKKLRRKLKRARRRARRAENQSNTAGYWDGWWDSNSYDDDYYYPPAYPQPMYIPPPVVQSGEPSPMPSAQGGGGDGSKWVVFAGLVFVMFIVLMIMISMK